MHERSKERIEQAEGRESDPDPVHDERSDEVLPDHPPGPAGDVNRLDEDREIVPEEHDVGALPRDVGPGPHRHPDGRCRERRGVVHAITNHDDLPAAGDEAIDAIELRFRKELRLCLVDTKFTTHGLAHSPVIARKKDRSQAHRFQRSDRRHRLWTERVSNEDDADEASASRDEHLACCLSFDARRRHRDAVLSEEGPIPGENLLCDEGGHDTFPGLVGEVPGFAPRDALLVGQFDDCLAEGML